MVWDNFIDYFNSCLKRAGDFYWITKNRPLNFAFKGGLFQNRYNHEGQAKYSSYAQYTNVFYNSTKSLFIRFTAFYVNICYIRNIVVLINIIVFL